MRKQEEESHAKCRSPRCARGRRRRFGPEGSPELPDWLCASSAQMLILLLSWLSQFLSSAIARYSLGKAADRIAFELSVLKDALPC
jgi:hypothetical protein